MSNNVTIKIDGVEVDNVSLVKANPTYCVVQYENKGLDYGEHSVEIINNSNAYIGLDAIDIDSTGSLLPYN